MNNRLYDKYLNFKIWKILDKAIADLADNGDIEETTQRYYIIGYLIKILDEANLLKEKK
jgi:hypothetical protein